MAPVIPSSYPGRAVIYVVTHLNILKLVLRYFVQEIIPVYWIFRSLTDAHHRRLFLDVLVLRGVDPAKVSRLSEKEKLELRVLTSNNNAKVEKRKHKENPVLAAGVWLFTPPLKQDGRIAYFVHRIITIPIRSVLPFLPVLFGAIKSGAVTQNALTPYFELKGIEEPAQQAAVGEAHKWSFRQFGGAALVLECIPILTLFLQFVTTVAAAMWAADMEKTEFSLVKRERVYQNGNEEAVTSTNHTE
ncbi:hypothetical protein WJX73_004795 [Symbiochloris irregularis]|uniref:Uncharacterized protein n=1 Tax=Symbiochloris irregularis TaxID=706552 RepID=A0AAW1PUQ9_9CHLO